jgi:hypothetical protein
MLSNRILYQSPFNDDVGNLIESFLGYRSAFHWRSSKRCLICSCPPDSPNDRCIKSGCQLIYERDQKIIQMSHEFNDILIDCYIGINKITIPDVARNLEYSFSLDDRLDMLGVNQSSELIDAVHAITYGRSDENFCNEYMRMINILNTLYE